MGTDWQPALLGPSVDCKEEGSVEGEKTASCGPMSSILTTSHILMHT